ncbi:MAG: hypothetical protein EBZ24_10355 [Synechococcaceae bacterium WB9_4xB_025]|nr:hypothetical protein [Synechococcaceae bacterium WB9_4xB_025]
MAVLIPLALFLVMVSLGLGLPRVEFDLLRTRPAFLLRVLVGSCVLVPLVAFVLLKYCMVLTVVPLTVWKSFAWSAALM